MQLPDSTRTETQSRVVESLLMDIVVWLLKLNTLQKHPPVAAARDSHSEKTFLKGFETLLVFIVTTILLPRNF